MQTLNKILNYKKPLLGVGLFSIWFSLLILLSQIYLCVESLNGCLGSGFFKMLAQWDGQNFLSIIQQGYYLDSLLAFFPLFPLVVKSISLIIPFGEVGNGLIFNWIIMGVSMLFLHKLLEIDFKKKEIGFIILLNLLFPFSFFFITYYSEALFFCLSVLVLFYYKKQKFYLTILFLFLLTLTRMAGVALVMAIIVDQIRLKKNPALFFIPFVGTVGYVYYSFLQTGNLFALINAEENWQRLVMYPGFSILNSLHVLLTQGISFGNFGVVFDLLLVLGVIILLVRSYSFLPKIYWYYALFSVLIPLSTSTFLSFPRFLIVLFPLFIAFYRMSNTIVRVLYLLIGFIIQQILFWSFLQGGWVA